MSTPAPEGDQRRQQSVPPPVDLSCVYSTYNCTTYPSPFNNSGHEQHDDEVDAGQGLLGELTYLICQGDETEEAEVAVVAKARVPAYLEMDHPHLEPQDGRSIAAARDYNRDLPPAASKLPRRRRRSRTGEIDINGGGRLERFCWQPSWNLLASQTSIDKTGVLDDGGVSPSDGFGDTAPPPYNALPLPPTEVYHYGQAAVAEFAAIFVAWCERYKRDGLLASAVSSAEFSEVRWGVDVHAGTSARVDRRSGHGDEAPVSDCENRTVEAKRVQSVYFRPGGPTWHAFRQIDITTGLNRQRPVELPFSDATFVARASTKFKMDENWRRTSRVRIARAVPVVLFVQGPAGSSLLQPRYDMTNYRDA
ncbi:hypothetical protein BDW22DRAFT_1418257 [Trametopsis cervina]|nr:hypothetical protein BDW22DRAFT_1418257 [Trametopsis cervina]